MRTGEMLSNTPALSSTPDSPATVPPSPWHSPVPYLFGGLAAMLGLIAFALLILACSYWKLSGNFDNEEDSDRDLENSDEKNGGGSFKAPPVYEEKIAVVMAGDEKPTYLATPMCRCGAASFGSNTGNETEGTATTEKPKQDNLDEEQHVEESRTIAQGTRVPNEN